MESTLTILGVTVRAFALLFVLMSAAPFLKVGWWAVRVLDFPRLQIAALCGAAALALIPFAWRAHWHPLDIALLALVMAAGVWQLSHVFPYTRLRRAPIGPTDTPNLTLLIANLTCNNRHHDEARAVLEHLDADLLILIEIDSRWFVSLSKLRDRYPHRIEHIAGDGLGMVLWSRTPLNAAAVKRLVSQDRVSMHCTLNTSDGVPLQLIAIHPAPPGLPNEESTGLHDSRERDAELIMVADIVSSQRDRPWIVAGDFNDVAWSHTTRLFQRISGLKDPRVGRGLFNTYNANWPILRYPLDHVFVSPGMRIAKLGRVRIPGSDHFGITAAVHLDPNDTPDPHADTDDNIEADSIVTEGHQQSADDAP